MFCGDCGTVVEDESLLHNPAREKKSRVGAPSNNLFYDRGLATSFDPGDVKELSPDMRNLMWRLKKWDSRSRLDSSKMRNLNIALTELERVVDSLHLPGHIKEHSAHIYRKALDKNLIRGRSIPCFVAASVYAACRYYKVPRSLYEVSEASGQELLSVAMHYRILLKELDIRMPIDNPTNYLPKIAAKVGVNIETERITHNILKKAHKARLIVGKDPRSMTAAALYMASKANDDVGTQKSIAEAAGITEVTLRNRLRDLENLFTNEYLNKVDYATVLDSIN
jgi:transcription initiation factor TFIIB